MEELLATIIIHGQTIAWVAAGLVVLTVFSIFYRKAGGYSHNVRSEWRHATHGMLKDKRLTDRVKCNLVIELLDGDRVADIGRVLNLSGTGVCFASSVMLKSGQYLTVRLPAMRKGPNKMLARVMWRQLTRMSTIYGAQLNPSTR